MCESGASPGFVVTMPDEAARPVRKSIRKVCKTPKAQLISNPDPRPRAVLKKRENEQVLSTSSDIADAIKDHDVDHACESLFFGGGVECNVADLLVDLQDPDLQNAANQSMRAGAPASPTGSPTGDACVTTSAAAEQLLWHVVATPEMMRAFARTVACDCEGRSISASKSS